MRPDASFIGQNVRSLQTMLRVIGQDEGRILSVIPDGFFGPQTQAEVTRFQQQRGLPITGVANQETWERIVAEYQWALTRLAPAEPVQIVLNPGKVFRKGDKSHFILLMQAMLVALADVYNSISAPEMSGIFDEITEDAVSSFQFLSNLPQTGEMDKITWKHLALQYPLAVNHKETENRQQK